MRRSFSGEARTRGTNTVCAIQRRLPRVSKTFSRSECALHGVLQLGDFLFAYSSFPPALYTHVSTLVYPVAPLKHVSAFSQVPHTRDPLPEVCTFRLRCTRLELSALSRWKMYMSWWNNELLAPGRGPSSLQGYRHLLHFRRCTCWRLCVQISNPSV